MSKKKNKKVHAEKEAGWYLKSPIQKPATGITGSWQFTDYPGWAHTSVNVEFTHNGTRYRGTAYPVGDE